MRLSSADARASVRGSVMAAGLCALGQSFGWTVPGGAATDVDPPARASAAIEPSSKARCIFMSSAFGPQGQE